MSIVVAKNLTKYYGSNDQLVKALDEIDLDVADGERLALVGRSGSGKTTLLNLLAGLDRPTSGELSVAGRSLGTLTSEELAHYRSRDVGVVFQSFQLLPHRNALQNVEIPLTVQGVGKRERNERAMQALDRVGLAVRVKHRPSELSGGEQQRVAIARAIVHRPKLLLADEPTGNLDSKTADQVTELILEVVAETKSAMILITHDSQLARRCSTRSITLCDGTIGDIA